MSSRNVEPLELAERMLDHALEVAWDEDPVYLAYRAGYLAALAAAEIDIMMVKREIDSLIREYENDERLQENT